jgi:hypothetical protein
MIASRRWQDWGTALLGVLFFISPFVYSTTSNAGAAWTAFVLGALAFLAGVALLAAQTFEPMEYGVALLGAFVFLSPWVIGFAGLASIAWTAWIIGVLLVLLAGTVLVPGYTRHPTTTA